MLYTEVIERWEQGLIEELMNKFYKNFTYSSNKIENNQTRLKDVETIFKNEMVVDFKGDIKTIIEIENHKEVCFKMLELCEKYNSKLSIELIKEMHFLLMKNCFSDKLLQKGERPGEFKKGDYIVGVHEVGVSPEDVEENLKSLIEEVNEVEITEKNVLKIVSYFHCWFETIHPFADGNGRVGRMLLNYLLIGNNFPPIIIFEHDKQEYYTALECFNDNQEIEKMINFLDEESYKTWVKDYNLKYKNLETFLEKQE